MCHVSTPRVFHAFPSAGCFPLVSFPARLRLSHVIFKQFQVWVICRLSLSPATPPHSPSFVVVVTVFAFLESPCCCLQALNIFPRRLLADNVYVFPSIPLRSIPPRPWLLLTVLIMKKTVANSCGLAEETEVTDSGPGQSRWLEVSAQKLTDSHLSPMPLLI